MDKLKEIIERAYQVVSHYHITEEILEVCTHCCVNEEEINALVNLPLSELSRDLLSTYNHAAHPEKPNINGFRHFLPRFLELTASFNSPTHSTELALRRIGYYDQDDWTNEEWEVISTFQLEFFKHALDTTLPTTEPLDEIIILLYNTKMDIETMLSLWKESYSLSATKHFADLINFGFHYKTGYIKYSNLFTDEIAKEAITNWINNETKTVFRYNIEHFIMISDNLNEQELNELSRAYEAVKEQT